MSLACSAGLMSACTSQVMYQLARYVGFDPGDQQTLAALGPMVDGAFPAIVERFYAALQADPQATAVLQGPQQVQRLKTAMRGWLEGVFSGVYDDAYYEKRARIGRMHVRVGLEQRFMFSAMNVLRLGILEAVSEVTEGEARTAAHASVNKICDIELGIMLETYREDYVLRRTAESETMAAMGKLTAGLAHEILQPSERRKVTTRVDVTTCRGVRRRGHSKENFK